MGSILGWGSYSRVPGSQAKYMEGRKPTGGNSNEHSIWPYLNCELFMCTFHRVWTLSQRLHNCRRHNSNECSIWPYLNCKLFVCVFHRVWTLGQVLRSYSLFVNATSLAFTVFMYWYVKYMSSAVSYDNSGYWTNLRENICLSSFIYLLYIIYIVL